MTNAEIKDALDTAVDRIFDVGQELKARGWDPYDARKLAGSVETFRDALLANIKPEAIEDFERRDWDSQRMVADRERGYEEIDEARR